MPNLPLNGYLHVELDLKILRRIDATAQKLGMTKREFVTRMTETALPEWEKSASPGPKR